MYDSSLKVQRISQPFCGAIRGKKGKHLYPGRLSMAFLAPRNDLSVIRYRSWRHPRVLCLGEALHPSEAKGQDTVCRKDAAISRR